MRILVTGAAGFMGSYLCEELLKSGHEVFGIDNFFRGKKSNLPKHKKFKFYEIDLNYSDELQELLQEIKPEVIYHYAAINGTKYFYDIPFKVFSENVQMTVNLLNSTPKSTKKVIYASSSEIYGPTPKTPTSEDEKIELNINALRDSYAASKVMGEFYVKLWAKENNRSYIILRPFNTYGPRMATNGYGQVIPEFIERIKTEEQFYMFGNGEQTRSFCHVHDHAEIAVEILSRVENEILNIGFDEEITIKNLAEYIFKALKKPINITHREEWPNDTKWRKPCLKKLKSYVGEKRYISLEEGINQVLNYKSHQS